MGENCHRFLGWLFYSLGFILDLVVHLEFIMVNHYNMGTDKPACSGGKSKVFEGNLTKDICKVTCSNCKTIASNQRETLASLNANKPFKYPYKVSVI